MASKTVDVLVPVALDRAYVAFRADPWADPDLVDASHDVALAVAQADASGANGRLLFATLETPFTMFLCNEKRIGTLYRIARASERDSYGELTLAAVRNYEPNPLWTEEFLRTRLGCYSVFGDPRLAEAQDDVLQFSRATIRPFGKGTRLDGGG